MCSLAASGSWKPRTSAYVDRQTSIAPKGTVSYLTPRALLAGLTSVARRDAASPLRYTENRTAGVLIRVGAVSSTAPGRPDYRKLMVHRPSNNRSRRGDREAGAGGAVFRA